jgi:predicted dehydrogenase
MTYLTRRRFLRGAAAAAFAAPHVVGSSALGADGSTPPSERICTGHVGFRAQGGGHLRSCQRNRDTQVVGVCDVDYNVLKGGEEGTNKVYADQVKSGQYKGVFATRDFRELLDRPDLDAVVIATPDHWHAAITVAACKAGKDVYCEKPMSLTVADGRAMVDAVDRYGRVFQCGSQQRSDGRFRFGCELVRNGRIGRLQQIEVGIPGNNKSCEPSWEAEPVPPELDYNMWLGPAPWAPYHHQRCHYQFRFILDYSGGQVTNWGAHHLDIAQWGNGTDDTGPVEIEGNGEFPKTGLFTTATKVDFTCTYASGVRLRCATGGSGTKFIGTEGWVFVRRGHISAEPASLLSEKIGPDEIQLYRPHGSHMSDWLYNIRTRGKGAAHAEIGHRSASICHLGNTAMRLGRKAKYDPATETFPGDPEANAYLARAPRSPWPVY